MASIGSESPPRKKLKQARLPFQVISSPRTEGEKASAGIKRKFSDSDDIQITKVVRSADVEEIKENTGRDDLKNGIKATLSTLLTSKIINKCTESDNEENISKEKIFNKEESPSNTCSYSGDCISNTEDSEQKTVLSKNALDKLASWKKSPCNTPSKSEHIPTKVGIAADAEKKTSPSDPCQISSKALAGDPDSTESSLEAHSKADPASSIEALELKLKNIEKSSCEGKITNLLETAVKAPGKPEDHNQSSNHSGNSSIVEIDLEAECPEGDKMEGDFNELSNTTASPKALQCNSTASPKTPKQVTGIPKSRLTPKQLARMKEAARKEKEKQELKLIKERKKQEELDEKIRLKQEKEEQKRKEKEEKEEQRRKEKEEKEKKRLADIEQKNEEKRRRDEKAEEKRKKEDEKRKAEKEEERKMAKESAMFTSFFVPKTSKPAEKDTPACSPILQNFMPFEVKSDMRIAPCTRDHLDTRRLEFLDEILVSKKEYPGADLYLAQLRRGTIKIGRSGRTWLREETKDEEVAVLEPGSEGIFIQQPQSERMRAKFLQFHENYRPAYYGTWRKKSKTITGRRPIAQDGIFDYDVDSADEWEEEEPGESLHGSDDEKEKESEDEYEVDNSVFVPHGYLSDDEGDAEIDEDALNPEMQKAKLKILGEEFETQMKTKTSVLKPIVILLTAAMQSAKLPSSVRYQKLVDRRAVWREDEGPIDVSCRIECCDSFGISPLAQRLDTDGVTHSGSRRAPKKDLVDEAIPALITLLHGAPIKGSFLVSEFYEFLKRRSERSEDTQASPSSKSENVWPELAPSSKASIARKLKELATYEQCNEEGPMKGKRCWVVPPEVRERYGLANLELPNRWKFILKRSRPEKAPVLGASPSSADGAFSTDDVPTSSAKKCLITNFTKVMTAEEKQLDWKRIKKSPPAKKNPASKFSHGKITAFTSLLPASAAAVPTSPTQAKAGPHPPAQQSSQSPVPQVKKRVALLVSVPRGQDISSAVEAARISCGSASATSGSVPESEASSSGIEPPKPSRSEEIPTEVIDLD